jgi:TFIIF-interacting CTD phosphatase-like protein
MSGNLKKPRVVLDLDQTLISAEASEDYNFDKNKAKAKMFKYHDMDGYYIVFERPGVQPFLDFLFANYTVSVWTAASKDYALFVIKNIILTKSDRRLDHIFFSYHCDISSLKKTGTKDLTTLNDIFQLPGYNRDTTVILDDYDEVHKTQPGNCIIAIPFEFGADGSEGDAFLQQLQPHMERLARDIDQGRQIQDNVKDVNAKMIEWHKSQK